MLLRASGEFIPRARTHSHARVQSLQLCRRNTYRLLVQFYASEPVSAKSGGGGQFFNYTSEIFRRKMRSKGMWTRLLARKHETSLVDGSGGNAETGGQKKDV